MSERATHHPRERMALSWPMVFIGLIVLFVFLAPALAPHDPIAQNLLRALEGPSATHPLGTDHVGRDVLSRLLHGAPRSLGLAFACIVIATGLGTGLGMLAAYAGDFTESLIMRLSDMMLAFPGILLALLLAGFMGGGVIPLLIGVTLTLWPQFARIARAKSQGILVEPHVEAAELAGFGTRRILVDHVLPGVIRQVLPLATLGLGGAIMSISALGFLGLGLQPPIPEWGAMISEMLPYMHEAPVQMAAPCLAIVFSVLGATLVEQHMTRGLANLEKHHAD
jgi:ABC-type dipeptide/oligopeptide/nickel transport system permease subunit